MYNVGIKVGRSKRCRKGKMRECDARDGERRKRGRNIGMCNSGSAVVSHNKGAME